MDDKFVLEKFESRKFRILLYPDDVTHSKALDYIERHFEKYIYILHDKDVEADGTPKKPHWHVIVEFPNSRYNTALAKQLGITSNYILRCNWINYASAYLLHVNNDDKHLYDISECKGTLVGKLKDLLNKGIKSECDKVLDVLDFIEQLDTYCSYTSLIRYCCEVGIYDALRRGGSLICHCLDEHNAIYIKKLDKD